MVIPIWPFVSELKCRLPNRIGFDVYDRCFCKFETRARETLRSCAKRLGGLAVTILPGASRSFNPALVEPRKIASNRAPHLLRPALPEEVFHTQWWV